MPDEYRLQRHSAYFKGWCQAFGEHDSVAGDGDSYWLYGGDQVGLLLPETHHIETSPLLSLAVDQVRIGAYMHSLAARQARDALERIRALLEAEEETNIYLTSHFMYGPGPKIITFSNKRPLSIIYKEIGSIQVRLV